VVIRSKIDSDAVKQAADGIAKAIDGVKTVKNDLHIALSEREVIDDKDGVITTRVN
jgi:hypothetical protein